MKISNKFPPGYVENLFSLWYMAGKPSISSFYSLIPEEPNIKERPPITTVSDWLRRDEWKQKTELLDAEVSKAMQEKYLAATVEMFERHADIGREMQTIAVDWLRKHKDELGPGTAVRLLVEGVNMEQDTASIPEMLKKLKSMDDEKLLNEIQTYLTELPSELDAN